MRRKTVGPRVLLAWVVSMRGAVRNLQMEEADGRANVTEEEMTTGGMRTPRRRVLSVTTPDRLPFEEEVLVDVYT